MLCKMLILFIPSNLFQIVKYSPYFESTSSIILGTHEEILKVLLQLSLGRVIHYSGHCYLMWTEKVVSLKQHGALPSTLSRILWLLALTHNQASGKCKHMELIQGIDLVMNVQSETISRRNSKLIKN